MQWYQEQVKNVSGALFCTSVLAMIDLFDLSVADQPFVCLSGVSFNERFLLTELIKAIWPP